MTDERGDRREDDGADVPWWAPPPAAQQPPQMPQPPQLPHYSQYGPYPSAPYDGGRYDTGGYDSGRYDTSRYDTLGQGPEDRRGPSGGLLVVLAVYKGGRLVAEAISSMFSVEVLDARIASGRVALSSSANTCFFSAMPSKTASTTMSASLKRS